MPKVEALLRVSWFSIFGGCFPNLHKGDRCRIAFRVFWATSICCCAFALISPLRYRFLLSRSQYLQPRSSYYVESSMARAHFIINNNFHSALADNSKPQGLILYDNSITSF